MNELFSMKLEIRFIKTVCCNEIPERARTKMLGSVGTSFFQFPPAKQAFLRIRQMFQTHAKLVDFVELTEDLSLETDFREILENSDVEPCYNKGQVEKMLAGLDNYRKVRIIYNTAKEALDALQGDKIRVDDILNRMSDHLATARSKVDLEEQMVVMGRGSNSAEVIQRILYSDAPRLLKTGFEVYDNTNGGLPRCGVMIIASTSSGGKSVMLTNLLKQVYLLNLVSVCKVSLEMTEDQEMQRLASNITGIPFRKFRRQELDKKECKMVERDLEAFEALGKKFKIRHAMICPTSAVSMDDVLMTLKPYGFDVLAIDYISLLEGVDADNQWRIMGSITAQAKRYSRETKSLVIILAQLDETSDKLRYSRAIKENADVLWQWNYNDDNREARQKRVCAIKVGKDRDGERFEFDLEERFDIMKFLNIAGSTSKPMQDESSRPMNARDDDHDEMLAVERSRVGVA